MKSKTVTIAAVLLVLNSLAYAEDDIGCSQNSGYIDNKNGTISDPRTNLTWQICVAGQEWNGESCGGTPTWLDMKEATIYAASNQLSKFNDWRIPEYEEFLSILGAKKDALLPSENVILKSQSIRIDIAPPSGCNNYPYPKILPPLLKASNSNLTFWTSTVIKGSESYYGITFSTLYNKYRGVEIGRILPSNEYVGKGFVKLVRGGVPRGDFQSESFSRIVDLYRRENKEMLNRQQREATNLKKWRERKFSVGDDTFCGAVVEIRNPMIKIAVNAQLQGFGSEAWIKISDAFPPEYGCKNLNGRLSPLK